MKTKIRIAGALAAGAMLGNAFQIGADAPRTTYDVTCKDVGAENRALHLALNREIERMTKLLIAIDRKTDHLDEK